MSWSGKACFSLSLSFFGTAGNKLRALHMQCKYSTTELRFPAEEKSFSDQFCWMAGMELRQNYLCRVPCATCLNQVTHMWEADRVEFWQTRKVLHCVWGWEVKRGERISWPLLWSSASLLSGISGSPAATHWLGFGHVSLVVLQSPHAACYSSGTMEYTWKAQQWLTCSLVILVASQIFYI